MSAFLTFAVEETYGTAPAAPTPELKVLAEAKRLVEDARDRRRRRLIAAHRSVLDRITYRPGYVLDLRLDLTDPADAPPTMSLWVGMPTFNAEARDATGRHLRDEGMMIWNFGTRPLEDIVSDLDMLLWVEKVTKDLEDHERAEWLRMDGRPLREPHPELLRLAPVGDGTFTRESRAWLP